MPDQWTLNPPPFFSTQPAEKIPTKDTCSATNLQNGSVWNWHVEETKTIYIVGVRSTFNKLHPQKFQHLFFPIIVGLMMCWIRNQENNNAPASTPPGSCLETLNGLVPWQNHRWFGWAFPLAGSKVRVYITSLVGWPGPQLYMEIWPSRNYMGNNGIADTWRITHPTSAISE